MTENMIKAAGGTRGLPMHLKKKKKKVTRLRKARQNRRWVAYSGLDGLERAIACRLEHLELTNHDDDKSFNAEEDDDEYDLDNDRLDGPVKKKMKRASRSKAGAKKDRKLQRFTSLEKVHTPTSLFLNFSQKNDTIRSNTDATSNSRKQNGGNLSSICFCNNKAHTYTRSALLCCDWTRSKI